MAVKWITAAKGIRYREHESRLHGRRPDRKNRGRDRDGMIILIPLTVIKTKKYACCVMDPSRRQTAHCTNLLQGGVQPLYVVQSMLIVFYVAEKSMLF